jgi:hypothetical protein
VFDSALTSTPQTLFIVPTMLILQLLFLSFYRLNAAITGQLGVVVIYVNEAAA